MKLLYALFFALLSSCGGSSAAPQTVVSLYGDSLFPVYTQERLQALLGDGYTVQRRADPGKVIYNAWTGVNWPWLPYDAQLRADAPNIVVLRFGGGDAIGQTDLQVFRTYLTQMVDEAKALGSKVYLVGVIPAPAFPQASAATNQVNIEVAAQEAVEYINLRDLAFDPAQDLADIVHPSQGYNDRIVQRLYEAISPHG